ncbi:MAG: ATP phosphoribosyltransferase [Candidatus Hodgkinia cicadicola]
MTLSLIALPVKGRIREASDLVVSLAKLAVGDNRQLFSRPIHSITLIRMPASEIASGIASGKLPYGITGLDLMTEACLRYNKLNIELCCHYDLCRASLSLMIPKMYGNINNVNDLHKLAISTPLRVVSKYKFIVSRFLRSHGFKSFVIIDSQLPIELSPFILRCHAIVDVTTSKSTAQSNFLKVIQTPILLTNLCLFYNPEHDVSLPIESAFCFPNKFRY